MFFSFGHNSCFKLASNVSRVCEVAENGEEYFSPTQYYKKSTNKKQNSYKLPINPIKKTLQKNP